MARDTGTALGVHIEGHLASLVTVHELLGAMI